ncbi:hypothetical protein MLD38_035609 [Melastoma candidum]|uniref:Uncharacterized protein n=1 Tax=Melastoma candidum TaxID=119954 RepID=A0ACB9LH53_9MYRT|nr:hypothetical protein MLD38_035609 [Melastoma candidum]
MASRQVSKSKNRLGSTSSRIANSPASSTSSSSRQYQETSNDGQSSPASSSARSKPQYFCAENLQLDTERIDKENVTVTVRFRPLSPREIRQGEEIAWYADGKTIVRNEHNPSIAYAYDRVFGPTTTTRHVYDVASQHIVSGAMKGINGTIFAYGVTSSGKTHTMHGDQRSPGIIPLAVKDAFSIIQETPNREFLLRVSYLEIYNEVVNDLLNPAGQNLRIREDAQGTFVEGVKEEVVLSPAHALSLIAAGEEHRHVGSTNFNLLSSRSHTIFTLTIESSPCGENSEGEAVTLSQLNLIDLAGSESSKVETTGVRRKEGSYINKSLLTLGTVISKLTEGRNGHIPYRDSKLTRLLQSSLSGHGHVSLICTLTPSSSNSEETHNTLKFAHRAKHIEIRAAQNKIIDEKSLIKKYQNEIRRLKEELEQLKRGIIAVPAGEDNIILLKQKLEDGQRLQSRLEQEEEAKAALMGRIQRLTKLILVSTKDSQPSKLPIRPGLRRRHSFGEEELAYLPHKRRDLMLDDDNTESYVSLESHTEAIEDSSKDEKKNKKHGLLNWLKPKKRESGGGTPASTGDKLSGVKSISTPSTPQSENGNILTESRPSHSLITESSSPFVDIISEAREDMSVLDDNLVGQETPLSIKSIDQIDLLREQQKVLVGEVGLQTSTLKRLHEEASRSPQKEQIHGEMRKLENEIKEEIEQISLLEKQIASYVCAPLGNTHKDDASRQVADLTAQLNEKSFELEVKVADNRVIQEQLDQKTQECEALQETVATLKQQLADALQSKDTKPQVAYSQRFTETRSILDELCRDKTDGSLTNAKQCAIIAEQATEIKELKQKLEELSDSNNQLELRNQKLAEDSSYAKGLASAAAVELKALSEEVTKLLNHNEKLTNEITTLKSNSSVQRRTSSTVRNGRRETLAKRIDPTVSPADMKRELAVIRERELAYEAALQEKDQKEAELQKKVEESKQREAYLENELANMWVLVAKLKKSNGVEGSTSPSTS